MREISLSLLIALLILNINYYQNYITPSPSCPSTILSTQQQELACPIFSTEITTSHHRWQHEGSQL